MRDEHSKHFSLLLGQYLSSGEENKLSDINFLGESEYGEESSFTSENSKVQTQLIKKTN